jgi:hypothetical protein
MERETGESERLGWEKDKGEGRAGGEDLVIVGGDWTNFFSSSWCTHPGLERVLVGTTNQTKSSIICVMWCSLFALGSGTKDLESQVQLLTRLKALIKVQFCTNEATNHTPVACVEPVSSQPSSLVQAR